MKRVLIAVLSAGLLALAACGWESTPVSGIIVDLEHDVAESTKTCGPEYVLDPVTGKYKNEETCRAAYDPECYEVEIETPEGNVVEDCTTEEMFNLLSIGDVYTLGQSEVATSTPWMTSSPEPSPSTSD